MRINASSSYFLLGIIVGVFIFSTITAVNAVTVKKQKAVPTSTPTPTPVINPPKRFIIPKIGVDTLVEYVGLDYEGKMDVPQNADNVGWFQLGYLPGEKGNAVIDGHLDRETGAPAVFYTLNQLGKGDEIIVIDTNDKSLIFEVINVQSYPNEEFPSEEVFGPSNDANLILITCQGIWDVTSRNYSNRLAVTAKLLE